MDREGPATLDSQRGHMPIQVRCECGRQFKVADEHAGKRGQCPGCGKKIVIPAAPAAAKGGPGMTTVKAAPVKTVPVSAPPPPPADEGFEGVADLLNET